MRHPILLALLMLSAGLVAGFPASSAETTGWIASVDNEFDVITLHDGQHFLLPEDISGAALTEGARVRITYTTGRKDKTVQCVAIAPSRARPTDRTVGKPATEICSAMPPPPAGRSSRPIRLEKRNFRQLQR